MGTSTRTRARKPAKALQASTAAVKRSAPRKRMSEEGKAARAAEREYDEGTRLWRKLHDAANERASKPLMTMEDLIIALGGPDEIDNWLAPDVYSRWLKCGWVCRGYQLQVYLALTGLGYRHINPKLFGLDGLGWNYLLPPRMRLPELLAA
jgi:hypothetical protein